MPARFVPLPLPFFHSPKSAASLIVLAVLVTHPSKDIILASYRICHLSKQEIGDERMDLGIDHTKAHVHEKGGGGRQAWPTMCDKTYAHNFLNWGVLKKEISHNPRLGQWTTIDLRHNFDKDRLALVL